MNERDIELIAIAPELLMAAQDLENAVNRATGNDKFQELLTAAEDMMTTLIAVGEHQDSDGYWFSTCISLANAITAITGQHFGQPGQKVAE